MNNYNKPVKNTDEQIEELIKRWLIINDKIKAKNKIDSIWYYRLSQYFKIYQLKDISKSWEIKLYSNWLVKYKNKFFDKISFEDILDIYKFDKKLRLLTYDIIETFEVDFKSKLINNLSHKFNDSKVYLNDSIYKSNKAKLKILRDIEKLLLDSKFRNHEIWKHFLLKYNWGKYPPIWMLLNNVWFWFLLNFYNKIDFNIRKEISLLYWYSDYKKFSKIIQIIREVRNKIAHHDRLFNTSYICEEWSIKFVDLLYILQDFEYIIYNDNSCIDKIYEFYSKNPLNCISWKLNFSSKTKKSP